MKKVLISFSLLLSFLLCATSNFLMAQTNDQELSALIIHRDSLFWKTYNTCDLTKMGDFFSDDVEFYHDKGGTTFGLQTLIEISSKNLCNPNNNFRLRREAVEGTYKVFPLKKDNVIYGAVLTGEHVFYILDGAKPERLDGLAKFTHLWLLKNGTWKMARVLSYDHGPAPYRNKRVATTLPASILNSYTGKYKGAQSGVVEIITENNSLAMKTDNQKFTLLAEKENLFFSKERDLTFEFIKNNSAVNKLVVRENGNVVEELMLVK